VTDTLFIYGNFANLNPNFNGCSLILGVENPSENIAVKMIVLQCLLQMQMTIVWNVCHQVGNVCTALYSLTRKFKSKYCQNFVVL
jgi:hypothetical protein